MPVVLGIITYGIFSGFVAFIRLCFSHPLVTGAIFLLVFTVGSCRETFHTASIDTVAAMSATPDTIEQYVGSPDDCAQSGSEVVCNNTYTTTHTVGQRVTEIDYKRLDGSDFNTNEAFYHRVLTFLNIPYREPDSVTIDRIVWRVPGVGTITASSDSEMKVEGIVIRG